MTDQADYINPQDFKLSDEWRKKIIYEIDKEILQSILVQQVKLEASELPKTTTGNYAWKYPLYGVPVIEDPTKIYFLKMDIPEGKKPWYKRFLLWTKRLF